MFLQLKISAFWKASNSDSRSETYVELFKAAYEKLRSWKKIYNSFQKGIAKPWENKLFLKKGVAQAI